MKLIKLEKTIAIILMIILFLILFSTPLTIWLAKRAEKQKLLSQTAQSQITPPVNTITNATTNSQITQHNITQSPVETIQITQPVNTTSTTTSAQPTNTTTNTSTTPTTSCATCWP